MKRPMFTAASIALTLAATPLAAQTAMTPAQCEAMMMAGTQNYAASAVAGCTPYFQALARNATAPGTFATVITQGVGVTVSTSGTGG
ncbi:hypothetical protein [Gymnodinialimonas sp. 57CJ19]|uniref:hypothetical protein n=1 Tax=Gymnodinialimonas sp. 57CJ19 TaxID=3138498 RepID=UPI003134650A